MKCKKAIEQAMPILNEHRGYKQVLVDIINIILAALTLKPLWSNNWRFFVVNTDTGNTLEPISEFIDGKIQQV